MFMYNFINNKDSFLNIFHSEVLIVYNSGYTLSFVGFYSQRYLCFQKTAFFFKTTTAVIFSLLNFKTQYKI